MSAISPGRSRAAGLCRSVLAHPVLAVFPLALAARLLAVFGGALLTGGQSLFDDSTYLDLAAAKAADETGSWTEYDDFLYERTAVLLVPLTALFAVFGPSTTLASVVVAFAGAGAAAVVAAIGARWFSPRVALLAGGMVALLPSQVIVSSVVAKDPLTWLLLALLALAVAALNQAHGRALLVPLAGAALVLGLLAYLRVHTQIIVMLAMVLAVVVGGVAKDRWRRLAGVGLVVAFVPFVTGIGIAGLDVILNHGSLQSLREAHAVGDSAIGAIAGPREPAAPEAPPSASPRPNTPTQSPGATPEPETADEFGGGSNLSYLPRGAVAVLLEPFPWHPGGSRLLTFAKVENLIWYALLALALLSAPVVARRRAVLAFPVFAAGGLLVMWSLVDGNLGTAFRHRGEFVWAVCLLAAVGLTSVLERRGGRHRTLAETHPVPLDGPGEPDRQRHGVHAGQQRA